MSDFVNEASYPEWLRIARPISGRMSGGAVTIIDIGTVGALLEHPGELEGGHEDRLTFVWQDIPVEVNCEVTFSDDGFWSMDAKQTLFESQVRFTSRSESLYRFLDLYLDRVRKAQQANVDGLIEQNVIDQNTTLSDLGEARRSRSSTFVAFHLSADGSWTREPSSSDQQPEDGFTLSSTEDEDQMRLLRLSYEESDDEGRRMIREFAKMSIADRDSMR
ncbi:MAG: hypothetical protein WBX15_10475 [Thermoanaerobaculia bacterium]